MSIIVKPLPTCTVTKDLKADLSADHVFGDCAFLHQSTEAVDVLVNALGRGLAEFQEPSYFNIFRNLKRLLTPQPQLNIDSLKMIYAIWNRCIVALNIQNGNEIHTWIHCLIKTRKFHPNEFTAVVPGISEQELRRAFYHLYAIGYMFKAFSAGHNGQPSYIRKNIIEAVHFFHKGGIEKNDASLKRCQQVFLKHATSLEQPNK